MAECDKCKKDYDAGVEAAYKLGLLDGEHIAQKTIALLTTTNRAFLEEFQRLDYLIPNPQHPDTICVPIKIVAGIIHSKGRWKVNKRCLWIQKLKKVAQAQTAELIKYTK